MNREQLRSIPPEKLKIILQVIESSKGKNTNEILPLLLQANQQMQQQGLSFTSEETTLILDLLKQDMSPSELQKFNMMQSILASWGKN